MGFFINTNNMKHLRTYEQAHDYFNSLRPSKSRRWTADKRPLRNTRSTHLAVQQTEHLGVPCYDLLLYRAPIIRYFKPNDNGERAIWVQTYQSTSTHQFMWAHDWYSGKKIVDQSNEACHVLVSYEPNAANRIWGDEFTCKMVFDADMKLIREKSVHIPAFRRSSTATMRARRKALKSKIEVMLAMLEMQISSMIDESSYDIWEGANIGLNPPEFPLLEHAVRGVQMLEKGGNPSDDDMTRLMEYIRFSAKHTVRNTIDRRMHDRFVDKKRWRALTDDAPEAEGMFRDLPPDVQEIIAPAASDIFKAVTDRVMNMAGLRADSRAPMGMFPAKRPRSWYLSGPLDIADLLGADLYHKLVNRKGVVY